MYYVSVVDGPRYSLLAGPYQTHEEALAMVDKVRTLAYDVDPKAVFYAFGTCRVDGYSEPGLFNRHGLL